MNTKISLLLVDDHQLFTDGLHALLADEGIAHDIQVALNGQLALEIIAEKQPDLILLDINMPGIGGMEILKYLNRLYPAIKVIMLSSYNEMHLIDKAQREGARGYLIKNCTRDELRKAIADVVEGGTSFPNPAESEIPVPVAHPVAKQFNLTNREVEIIGLIREEYTNQQIAERLFLSVYTVETHRRNIMHKLQLKSPASLMKFIIEYDL